MAIDEQVFEEVDLVHVLKALTINQMVQDMRNNMFWTLLNYLPGDVRKDPKVDRFIEDIIGLANYTEFSEDFYSGVYGEVRKAFGDEKMETLWGEIYNEADLSYYDKKYDEYIQKSISGNRDPFGLNSSWLPDNLDSSDDFEEEEEEEEVPAWKRKRQ